MVLEVTRDTYNDIISGFVLYAKSTVDDSLVAVKVDPTTGALQITGVAGTALIGKVGIDQVTANANEVVVKSSALPTDASTHTGQDEQSVKLDSIIAALTQLAALQDKVIGEVVNEVPNGVNDTFTVDYAFAANSEQVVVNRQVMTRGASYDYVPTGASNQIVFNAGSIPAAAATIQVSYWKA